MSIGYINTGSVAAIDQDNKDVAKYVTLNKFGQSPLPNRILSFLNNSNPFTVTEIQNLWIFVNVVYDNNEIVEIQKIKVFNKGKGTYGAGNLQFSLSDLKLISTESLTSGAIVQDNHAKVIEFDLLTTFGTPDFAALTAGAISDKLNILSADILPIEIPFVKISKDVTGLYQIYVLEGIGAGNTSAVVASNVKLLVDASNDFTTALNGKQATLNETNFGSFANALNEKTIIVDDDVAIIGDSEDSNKAKKSKWSTIKNYFANLFILRSGTTAGNPITGDLEINSKEGEEKALILSKEGTVGITENPKFSFGRIVNGGINEPKLRIVFSDDEAYTSEVTCFEMEPSGTAASVRQVIGSHYEAFLEQEEKPLFRIASFLKDGNKSTRMEFGSGGNNETDIFLERWASWAFALVMGGSPKIIFYPDSILRQPGVVDAFQQTPIGQAVGVPSADVKKLFFREGKGLVELGNDGIERPITNTTTSKTQSFTATANQTEFTLQGAPIGDILFFRNSVPLNPSATSISGTTVTYIPANNGGYNLALNDIIIISYQAII